MAQTVLIFISNSVPTSDIVARRFQEPPFGVAPATMDEMNKWIRVVRFVAGVGIFIGGAIGVVIGGGIAGFADAGVLAALAYVVMASLLSMLPGYVVVKLLDIAQHRSSARGSAEQWFLWSGVALVVVFLVILLTLILI